MIQIDLTSFEQLEQIDQMSYETPQLIFKHSTRCNISADALGEVEKSDFKVHLLDLLEYRDLTITISEKYAVLHKSPQVLVIKNGVCIYHESHWRIANETIKEYMN